MDLLLLTRAVYPLHGYGGMERHCSDWIHTMVSLGCRIHVVTMTPAYPEGLSAFGPDVAFYLIPGEPARRIVRRITTYPRWVDCAQSFLTEFLKTTEVAAVYAHGLAAAGCEDLPVPVFYNPHGMEEFKTSGLKYLAYAPFRAMSRRGAALAHRVIATDRTLIPEIRKFLKVDEERIALIPNAVRMDTPDTAGTVVPVQGSPLFLSVGRMEQNKGFHILIEALSAAKDLPQEWKLAIGGTGSQEERLKHLAVQKGLRGKIAFLGALEDKDLNSLYKRADLFLNPTLFEGSSIVTLEAMKAGLPIVASRAGGLPDKVLPGQNGWLVPPGDPAALAHAIEAACAQRSEWKRMGEASAKIVREQYSWNQAGRRFLELLAEEKATKTPRHEDRPQS